MKRYAVRKGAHAFTRCGLPVMPVVRRRITRIQWQVHFPESAAYELPYPDDRDWNKGGGLSFDLTTNHRDATMWAWRWNAIAQVWEVTAYHHIDGARSVSTDKGAWNPDREVLVWVNPRQTLTATLTVDYGRKTYQWALQSDPASIGEGSAFHFAVQPFTHEKTWARTIGPWFGGNRPAPKDMEIFYTRRL